MSHLKLIEGRDQSNPIQEVEKSLEACEGRFHQIIGDVLMAKDQEAHQVESSIFRSLLSLGFLLLKLYFANHNQGDYGQSIETKDGIAIRGRTSERTYFSIFGKLEVVRYLYEVEGVSMVPLDIVLNLPKRRYSYFLSEIVNLLSIRGAYEEGKQFFEKVFCLKFSVSAMETIAQESWSEYEAYYEMKKQLPSQKKQCDFTAVSFDGKGVPVIKKEADSLKGKKDGKKGKKKEALVGVTYQINANVREAEEVANHLVFPDSSENPPSSNKERAQDIRYIASIEQSKKSVMNEIKQEMSDQSFSPQRPLVCILDGALYLWTLLGIVFKNVKNKVLILDIIHVLQYSWIIAKTKWPKDAKAAKDYVYKKLLSILKGNIASYIMELQNELMTGEWTAAQKKEFSKVITYFKNHKQYMKYDQYLEKGSPIGSGVVESACGHLVKHRTEIAGARWGIPGAEAILKLRSIVKSNHWDEYWEFFTKQKRNDDFFPGMVNVMNLQDKIAV